MKIFISYRRDDTGGRAGRLSDQLIAHFGSRNVFQDVRAITPGQDFMVEVTDAIERSHAVLVVIGTQWLRTDAAAESRRIDDPEDYVRREVVAALGTSAAVIPVLVDDARLPDPGEVPPDIEPLLRRQAYKVRDESWHVDVERLIRALEGEPDQEKERRRRPWWQPVVALLALAVAVAIAWTIAAGDAASDDTSADVEVGFGTVDADGNVRQCPEPDGDDGWSEIQVETEPVGTVDEHGVSYRLTPEAAAYRSREDEGWWVIVAVDVANVTEDPSIETPYLSLGLVHDLYVNGISQGRVQCFALEGNPTIERDQRAIGSFGYASSEDPRGAGISLAIAGANLAVVHPS